MTFISLSLILTALEAAYFSDSTIDSLGTIDDLPDLRGIQPPPGIFECAKSSKSKSRKRRSGEVHSRQSTSPAPPQGLPSFSSEPVAMIQPYVVQEAPKPSIVHPLPPIQLPPSHVEHMSDNPISWSISPFKGRSSQRPCYSLPPLDTFVYQDRTPSPMRSWTESPSSQELSPCNVSQHSYRDSSRVLAPIFGPRRRIYVRDPLDDKVLRRLPP